jgi:hypothetical protein
MLVLRPITLIEHNLRGGRKIQRDPTQTYHRGGAGDIKVMSHLMFGVLVWRQVNECDCCNSAAEEPATRHPKRCGYGMVLPVAGRAPRLLRCQPLKDRSIQISCQGRRNSQQGLYGTCRAADTSGVLTPCREFPFRSISTWHRSHSLFRSYRFLRFISAFFCCCDCLSSAYFNAPSGLAIRSSSSMPQPPLCELAGIEKARTMTGF